MSPRRANCFAAGSFTAVALFARDFTDWIRIYFADWPFHLHSNHWLLCAEDLQLRLPADCIRLCSFDSWASDCLPVIGCFPRHSGSTGSQIHVAFCSFLCLWRHLGSFESCGFVFCQFPTSQMSASDPMPARLNLSMELVEAMVVDSDATPQQSGSQSSSNTLRGSRRVKAARGESSGRRNMSQIIKKELAKNTRTWQ